LSTDLPRLGRQFLYRNIRTNQPTVQLVVTAKRDLELLFNLAAVQIYPNKYNLGNGLQHPPTSTPTPNGQHNTTYVYGVTQRRVTSNFTSTICQVHH
jgi:hypothetical protein